MHVLKAGALYFAVVFGAGFVLGPIRILWAVPRFGRRVAELMETPLMLAVIIVAARAIVRRLAIPPAPARRLGMGSVALALLLIAELTLPAPPARPVDRRVRRGPRSRVGHGLRGNAGRPRHDAAAGRPGPHRPGPRASAGPRSGPRSRPARER
jgi:hypothetical protein